MPDETTFTLGGFRTAAGPTDIKVRWPTDEEWSAQRRSRKIIRRDMGRGAYENELESRDADAKLYDAIKLDGAPPLTQAEASKVIELISFCEVSDVVLRAQDADVNMQTSLGAVVHTLRIPTIDEATMLNKANHYITLPFGRTEIRMNLEAAVKLWDRCGGKVEGYKGGVPNIHKDTAVRAVIEAVNQEVAPRHDESNF